MGEIRRRGLSPGWYPSTRREVELQCDKWREDGVPPPGACAVMVPHAGWRYSGRLSYLGLASLNVDTSTVVVIGGHLGAQSPVLIAMEDGFQTPVGELRFDGELAGFIDSMCDVEPDRDRENSVEIQLPILKYLMPDTRAVWIRAPASFVAVTLGEALGEWAVEHSIAVVASTDLTHYGPRFDFVKPGTPAENHRWVSTVNDRGFLDACVSGDAVALLKHAAENRSACSAGAVAAAVTFARSRGCRAPDELSYATSADIVADENMVGYAALAWYPPGDSEWR
jgi:MEMO1 family protein